MPIVGDPRFSHIRPRPEICWSCGRVLDGKCSVDVFEDGVSRPMHSTCDPRWLEKARRVLFGRES
jgi:hypothetical protein